MPCVLKVKINAARDLPVMDRSSELTDAYVEVKFGDFEPQRTGIARKTLNPVWNEDFRFEVSDDADLQNEPLEIRVFDYDRIINDMIGAVILDLNPLLTWASLGQTSGWFPIYDTLREMQGEINASVKLQFFGDVNPFKESSAGVQFFSTGCPPPGFNVTAMFGLVDDLLTEDDPEYHWSDSFRSPRVSNESRQRLFFRLAGNLRRLVGQKVLQLGGNAIVGYKQCFDLENEERSITARAIGTAVKLIPISEYDMSSDTSSDSESKQDTDIASPVSDNDSATPVRAQVSPSKEDSDAVYMVNEMQAKTTSKDDSDSKSSVSSESPPTPLAPIPFPHKPRQSSLDSTTISAANSVQHRRGHDYHLLDEQILTIRDFPQGSVLHLGGIVSARSVKLIEDDEEEVRDTWWDELREEIKSHARSLGCPHVIGYSETTTINDELCVLSANGTAAIIDMSLFTPQMASNADDVSTADSTSIRTGEPMSWTEENNLTHTATRSTVGPTPSEKLRHQQSAAKEEPLRCRMCHIPYSRRSSPFSMGFVRCGCCKNKYVAEMLLATIETPLELETVGSPAFVEAHVCRPKKRKEGETNAGIVSDAVPFIEYDLHRQLLYKLKIQGLNSIFGLKFHLAVGESLIVGYACGTASYLSALPTPPALRIARNIEVVDEEDAKLLQMQQKIMDLSERNRELLDKEFRAQRELADIEEGTDEDGASVNETSSDDSSDDSSELDADQYQHNAIVQVDDDTDEDLIAVLLDPVWAEDFTLCNTDFLPKHVYFAGLQSRYVNKKDDDTSSETSSDPDKLPDDMHLITMVKQTEINASSHHPNRQLASVFRSLYEELRLKLSYFESCVFSGIEYDIQLPNDNDIQIRMTGIALGKVRIEEPQAALSKVDVDADTSRQTDLGNSNMREGWQNGEFKFESPFVRKANGASLVAFRRTFTNKNGNLGRRARPSLPSIGNLLSMTFNTMKLGVPNDKSNLRRNGSIKNNLTASGAKITEQSPSAINLTEANPTTYLSEPPLFVDITPLSHIPGASIDRYLGRLSLHFVKEAHVTHDSFTGGIGSFANQFLMEVQSVARAHIAALGGNAIVGYHVDQTYIEENVKNQGYAILSLSGDVVVATYAHAHSDSDSERANEECTEEQYFASRRSKCGSRMYLDLLPAVGVK
ncbi:hypothetical protein BZG36_05105 [Bifiguratus adelaidae]|uniref:C2 domain-containing protein n=1 Tax=Bifiguratus adelaidae TaxID=1938954 RepID=A0A261XWK3_9FUNG|nr:hypothetical protein BZG36_05105 [Bifiguratus adelaidae]